MRLATYNIEWFNGLFDDAGTLWDDDKWSGRWNVTRAAQTAAVAHVLRALDADAIMIIEAPDLSRRRDGVYALEGFAARFGLRARAAVAGFANDTQQEIVMLYDPDALEAVHCPGGGGVGQSPVFDAVFKRDLDVDDMPEDVVWSKPPLELKVTGKRATWQMIGVHAKSKAPHGARSDADVMRISIENRRKQLAQCLWLRQRVDEVLAADAPVIVMGDFNDGPGLDAYEKLFGRSGVEVVLGSGAGALYDPNAAAVLGARLGLQLASARFYDREAARYFSALLDYVMVSAALRAEGASWRIWHPFDDPKCYDDPELRRALLTASDHFPVVLELDL